MATAISTLLRPDSTVRSFTIVYIIAFSLIALLSGISHFLLSQAIEQQHDAATVINVAGRQRMLSQRSALLAQDLQLGNVAVKPLLLEIIMQMERAHNALTRRNDLGISSPLSAKAADYYFKGANSLDTVVKTYVEDLRKAIAMPAGTDRALLEAQLHDTALYLILPRLNEAVSIFTDEANEKNASILALQRLVFIVLLTTLVLEALFIFRPMAHRLAVFAERLRNEAAYDALTGLLSRRHFFEASDRQILLARRTNVPCTAVLLDIDHFKTVNDTHGHAAGDLVLQKLGDLMRKTLRRSDLIGRIGGEEFALFLPGTNMRTALIVAEQIRRVVEHERSALMPAFTVSLGVTELTLTDLGLPDLLGRADKALYHAKNNGRNRVGVMWPLREEPQLMSNDPFALMTLATASV